MPGDRSIENQPLAPSRLTAAGPARPPAVRPSSGICRQGQATALFGKETFRVQDGDDIPRSDAAGHAAPTWFISPKAGPDCTKPGVE